MPSCKNLTVLIFAVPHQLFGVLRMIELTDRTVDAELAEHAFHAEGARLVGDDRHDARSHRCVANQRREDAYERHRRRNLALARTLELRVERRERGNRERFGGAAALRQGSVRRDALFEIAHLWAIIRRPIERNLRDVRVADRHEKAIAECAHRFDVEFLGLMGDVQALSRVAHAVAFDRFGQNDGRCALMIDRGLVRAYTLTGSWPPRSRFQICSSLQSATSAAVSG